ncbi:hypothetical protein [Rubrivirga sp. IMCC43871]|uniref:hypothetical protein n=1 Tax=Rubrivirga sp. IMCC43871 TaxID=3391575 RepID=UPI0039902137
MGLFSASPTSHVPLLKGRRLDGTDVRFPQDLPADATLLILVFQDDLDPLADQWARLGDRVAETHGDRFAVLELPVVSTKMKLLGDLGTMGIRGQIETDEERERTVPVYTDVKAFRKALKLKTGDVTALLVARDGRIAWRGDGNIDMDEVQGLEAAVVEVLAQPVPEAGDHPDLDGAPFPDDLDEDGDPNAGLDPVEDDGPPTEDDGDATDPAGLDRADPA